MTPQSFWHWFLQNEEDFYSGFPENRNLIVKAISENVRQVEKNITFLVAYQKLDGKIAVTFSPNGMRAAFEPVRQLTTKVPEALASRWVIKKHFP